MTDKITTVLWDVDGTLLDFIAAEKAAIRKLFKEYDLGECTDEMLARYSKINRTYWVKLENGEMTKPEILVGRFRDFFVSEGLDPSIASAFNEKYQDRLGDADSIVYCDDSLNLLKSLRGKNQTVCRFQRHHRSPDQKAEAFRSRRTDGWYFSLGTAGL